MPELANAVIHFLQKRAATEQGGLLSGKDPTAYNTSDPIRLWIIQVGIIVCTASLLSLGLSKIRQPKVIAEVLGGILLGPTAFGRIPGFADHIFPTDSIPFLSLVANIGLCLFLFLVGLEIDSGVIKRNVRLSATVALAGMVLPFGIGAGISVAIYKEFVDKTIKFTYFMLFSGVAFSITAFPVLCRILTELKLLDTTVGIVVLSAGVGNDIIGWILLALSVSLVNAGSGLTALYILLACVGWTIFLLFPVKMALKWLARKTGSIESGPSVFFMTVTMMIVFGSAFFTDVIGVHAIFGAFVSGLIVPREGGLAIALTEKLEDMVAIIFLPLYFTLSGLNTDLGLLDNGITWAYTILIIVGAFAGKFGGCALAARYGAGFSWREASTIGSLMSCKGLVELIVLNVGRNAGILSQRVFSMFVLEALVLTFMTTPLVTWLYPPQYRKRIDSTGPNFDNVADAETPAHKNHFRSGSEDMMTRFTIVLDKLEHLPGMMALTQLIQPPSAPLSAIKGKSSENRASSSRSDIDIPSTPRISAQALRVIELSDRVSAVMKSSNADALIHTDPLLSIFRMYGHLNGLRVNPSLSIVKFDDLAHNVAEQASIYDSDMIMIPWLPPTHDAYGGADPHLHTSHTPATPGTPGPKSPITNPFDLLFKTSGGHVTSAPGHDVSSTVSIIHSQFVRGVFAQAKTDVALFIDRSTLNPFPSSTFLSSAGFTTDQHLFLPFFGGPDDRLALRFLMQVCANRKIRGTVIWISKQDEEPIDKNGLLAVDGIEPKNMEEINALTVGSRNAGFPDTVYGQANTETQMLSKTADEIEWAKFAPKNDTTSIRSSHSSDALVEFKRLPSIIPLQLAIDKAQDVGSTNLLIVTGRSRRLAPENHHAELKRLMDEHEYVGAEVRKTIGDVATAFVVAGVGSGIIVLQEATGAYD